MTVGTNTIADIALPFTVPNGGSAAAFFTAYAPILAGTTATGAYQDAGTGTAGQIYISGGAGSKGTWTGQDTLGRWQWISTTNISSQGSVIITGLVTTYYAYKFIFYNLLPSVASPASFGVVTSADNGSTYGTSYAYATYGVSEANTNIALGSASSTHGVLLQTPDTTTNPAYLEVTYVDPATSYAQNPLFAIAKYYYSASAYATVISTVTPLATQVNNAVKFSYFSGNMASGTLEIYGILA